MLQDYAAPIEILNNGVAFSLPSSPKVCPAAALSGVVNSPHRSAPPGSLHLNHRRTPRGGCCATPCTSGRTTLSSCVHLRFSFRTSRHQGTHCGATPPLNLPSLRPWQGAACLLLSAFPRPYELLFLASGARERHPSPGCEPPSQRARPHRLLAIFAVGAALTAGQSLTWLTFRLPSRLRAAAVAVVSVSSRLFDRLWVAFNKERVFKYLPFETPRKLTGVRLGRLHPSFAERGRPSVRLCVCLTVTAHLRRQELVGGEKSIFGVPRVIFQMAGLIGTAFALSKTYSVGASSRQLPLCFLGSLRGG